VHADAIYVLSLNLGETEQGSGQCVGSLAAQDLGLGDGVFLLGDRSVNINLRLFLSDLMVYFVSTAS
jgi:hypothetical protein